MDYYVGIDLGGTNSKIGILDLSGKLHCDISIKTKSEEGAEKTLTRIWSTVKKLARENNINIKNIKGIGIGIPGPVIDRSVVAFFANFPWGRDVKLKKIMEKISGITTWLDNDANIIALGEAIYGAGKDFSSSVMVAIGTGIGGGIFANKKVISGFRGGAGEIGHMKLVDHGKLCGCGGYGCFEAYASATGLVRETVSRLTVNKDNMLWEKIGGDKRNLTAKHIFDMAKLGDKFSMDLVYYEAHYLAMGIGNILNILNPEAIILNGGVSFAGDILINPLKDKLKEYALPTSLENIKIVRGILGNQAGLYGCLALFV